MRNWRQILATALISTATAVAVVALAPAPAGATVPADCKTVTAHIENRPDSAVGGYDWAKDTFDRTAKICAVHPEAAARVVEVQSWTYTIEGTDSGTFTTTGVKSPASPTTAQKDGLTGQFSGDFKWVVEAPADWGLFKGAYTGNDKSTSQWMLALWSDGAKGATPFTYWKWTYKVCNEFWINADASRGGNKGNITGNSRVPCFGNPSFVDNCDGTTTVMLTNAAPSADSKAVYWVSGVTDHKGFVVVAGGTPGKVTVTSMPLNGKVTVKVGPKVKAVHEYVKPNCSTPSPSAPGPTGAPTTPAAGGSLPVTGPDAAIYGGGAAALLVAGGVLLLAARRRRIHFEA